MEPFQCMEYMHFFSYSIVDVASDMKLNVLFQWKLYRYLSFLIEMALKMAHQNK